MGRVARLSCRAVAPVAEPGSGRTAAVLPVYRLRSTGSAVELRGLSCSVWDLPVSGIEPMSPALAGRFFTTEPSGKPSNISFFKSKPSTSSLSLFQDELLQPSPAHTHAFPAALSSVWNVGPQEIVYLSLFMSCLKKKKKISCMFLNIWSLE